MKENVSCWMSSGTIKPAMYETTWEEQDVSGKN
jgi:hypothetical protein